jgi:hypothetical protein
LLIEKIIIKLNIITLAVKMNSIYLITKIAINISVLLSANSKYTLLCIGRQGFNEDIISMSGLSSKLNYWIVPKIIFTSIFNHYFSNIVYKEIHVEYHTRKGLADKKRRYKVFIDQLLDALLLEKNINAVISGNYVYAWQQEIASCCLDKGIPFIVIHKEGMTTKNEYDNLVKQYTNKIFLGTKMLVYNNNIKNALLSSNIKNLDLNSLQVIGAPRLDKYFGIEELGENIVFFSFYVEDKIRHLDLDDMTINELKNLSENFHAEVMNFAHRNRNVSVIIKTKSGPKYYDYVVKICKDNDYENLENLVITQNGDSYNLIKDAFCVIGYNSTTLVEGLISNRLLISPKFNFSNSCNYFDNYPDLINYVNNCNDIQNILAQNNTHDAKTPAIKKLFLEEYVYRDDGNSSKRAEDAIIKTINKRP